MKVTVHFDRSGILEMKAHNQVSEVWIDNGALVLTHDNGSQQAYARGVWTDYIRTPLEEKYILSERILSERYPDEDYLPED